jgi:Spx/MgsR family transcriptional regulator
MKAIIYGINNCDTVKAALQWLTQHNIDFQFYDFKKQCLTPELLQQFTKMQAWSALLNKRSTTFRQLPEHIKQQPSDPQLFAESLKQPTLLKRPLLCYQGQLHLGFKAEQYATIFQQNGQH